MEKSEGKGKGQISNLWKKISTTNKGVLYVLVYHVDLRFAQKSELRMVLAQLKYIHHLKSERIESLETRAAES